MSAIFDYLKAASSESSLLGRLGSWRQAASLAIDQLVEAVQNLSGGGLLPATGTTTGSRPLSGYATALLQTGDEVFVQGINEVYYFDASSTLAADQLNIVNAVGPGQFIRLSSVIVDANWFVDSVNGNDQNDGVTALTPIKTIAELNRRFCGRSILPSIANITITLAGTFTTEVLAFSGLILSRGQVLVVKPSTLTQVATGTITTYTARNAAGNTSATILADISFAGRAQTLMRLTSGASSGATAWVGFDLGGNTCRVGAFQLDGTAVTPTNGTTFVLETYPTAIGGVSCQYSGSGTMIVQDLEIQQISTGQAQYIIGGGLGSSGAFFEGGSSIYRCKLSVGSRWYYGTCFTGCMNTAAFIVATGQFIMQGHTFFATMSVRDSCTLTLQGGYVTFESINTTIGIAQIFAGCVVSQGADVEMFNCVTTTQGFLVSDNSTWASSVSARSTYGSGNTLPTAVQIRSGASWIYTNKPTITGTVQDTIVGGAALAWAAIPTITAANNAMIVAKT